jgi:WhiB family transcriptional regulator, redox-sensing transcriptional regulator
MSTVRLSVVPVRGAAEPAAHDVLPGSAEDMAWKRKAMCANGDPDALFVTGAAQREAARLCGGCPVKTECLAEALDNQVEFGVWGGMTERQRRALLKRCPEVTSWREVLEDARSAAVRHLAG